MKNAFRSLVRNAFLCHQHIHILRAVFDLLRPPSDGLREVARDGGCEEDEPCRILRVTREGRRPVCLQPVELPVEDIVQDAVEHRAVICIRLRRADAPGHIGAQGGELRRPRRVDRLGLRVALEQRADRLRVRARRKAQLLRREGAACERGEGNGAVLRAKQQLPARLQQQAARLLAAEAEPRERDAADLGKKPRVQRADVA